jgi:hypothetical protein
VQLQEKIVALLDLGIGYSSIAVRLGISLYPEWDEEKGGWLPSILGCAHRYGILDAEWTDRMRDHLHPRPLPDKAAKDRRIKREKSNPGTAADVVCDSANDANATPAGAKEPRSAEAAPHRPRGGKRRKMPAPTRRHVRKGGGVRV